MGSKEAAYDLQKDEAKKADAEDGDSKKRSTESTGDPPKKRAAVEASTGNKGQAKKAAASASSDSSDDSDDDNIANAKSSKRQETIAKLKKDIAAVGAAPADTGKKKNKSSLLEEARAGYHT